jgi:hypothetical protein
VPPAYTALKIIPPGAFPTDSQAQSRAKSREVTIPHPWTDEEIAAIEEDILNEKPHGATPRYWEDVNVGDEIDTITKGPIGLTDEIAYIAAGAAPIPRLSAHGVALRRYRKHPVGPIATRTPMLWSPSIRCITATMQRVFRERRRPMTSASSVHVLANPLAYELDGRRGRAEVAG